MSQKFKRTTKAHLRYIQPKADEALVALANQAAENAPPLGVSNDGETIRVIYRNSLRQSFYDQLEQQQQPQPVTPVAPDCCKYHHHPGYEGKTHAEIEVDTVARVQAALAEVGGRE